MYNVLGVVLIAFVAHAMCTDETQKQTPPKRSLKHNIVEKMSDPNSFKVPCGVGHCNAGQKCCSGVGCCASNTMCCGAYCCLGGQACCGQMCCSGQCCTANTCCPAGSYCCGNGSCCPNGSVCYSDRTCRLHSGKRSIIEAVIELKA